MRLITQALIVVLVLNLIAPMTISAQQQPGANIDQLREQIAKLEKIDVDSETSAEVKEINRTFLSERRAELNALMRRKISALRQYLSTAGDALREDERRGVEKSIRALLKELGDADAPEGRDAALATSAPAAESPSTVFFRAKADSGNKSINSDALFSFSASIPQPREYAPFSVMARSVPQDGVPGGRPRSPNTLTVDTSPTPKIPKPLEVRNEAEVTVGGTKSLINNCVVATKREELKPEPNPLAQFLKIVFSLGTIGLGKDKEEPSECKKFPAPDNPQARQIEAQLDALSRTLKRSMGIPKDTPNDSVEYRRLQYEEMADRIVRFTGCEGVAVRERALVRDDDGFVFEPICGDQSLFNSAKTRLIEDVERLLQLASPSTERELPVIASAELQLKAVEKLLTDGYRRTAVDGEEDWIDNVDIRLDCAARRLDILRKSRAFILSAHDEFETVLGLLTAHRTSFNYQKALIADSNSKVTGTVTCSNFFTKQVAFDPIPFTVTYQNPPRGAVSAGVLFTTLNKRQIGIQPVSVGTNADGTAIVRLHFAETDKADSQIVPFTFYNHRLWGRRKFSLNASGGIGVNPNNGSVQVEYFFGGSLGYNNFFLQLGGHVGRWQELGGGFTIGDQVAAPPPSVPIERRYSVRPAIGVSYKIPLP